MTTLQTIPGTKGDIVIPAGTEPRLLCDRSPMRGSHGAEVVVIGAGLSGLYAARLLAAKGVDVFVLEAQNRVGGRTLTQSIEGDGFIDHGGQWVSDSQDLLVALAQELGVALFPTWHDGQSVDCWNGVRSIYTGMFPPGNADAESEARRVVAELEKMADKVPLDAPWMSAKANEWDSQTLDAWLAAKLSSTRARIAVKRGVEGVFASGPGETSLLGALFVLNSAQDLVRHFATKAHGPDRRFVGGAQQLSIRMADAMSDRVALGAWVSHLEHGKDGVRAIAGDFAVTAKRAIVTLPPTLAGRVRYVPALPAARDALTESTPMGWVIKVHCVYASRFWQRQGLSGAVTSDEGAIKVTADNSPPSGSPAILVGFIEGKAARRLAAAPPGTRRAAALADMVRYFGDEAGKPLGYYEHSWGDDEFARGAYGGYWTCGMWTTYGPSLRAPLGTVHWAGTETAARWNGKMEGALVAGQRVANEVLSAIGKA